MNDNLLNCIYGDVWATPVAECLKGNYLVTSSPGSVSQRNLLDNNGPKSRTLLQLLAWQSLWATNNVNKMYDENQNEKRWMKKSKKKCHIADTLLGN